MSINPGYRLVMEGTGVVIGHLPNNTPSLNRDDEIDFGPAGGATVTYKVEQVRYIVEYNVVGHPSAPDSYSAYGRTDLVVSVVTP